MSHQSILPEFIVSKTRFVHVNDDGSDMPFETGVRILLRYPRSNSENRSFEVADVERETSFMDMSDVELMHHLHFAGEQIVDLIAFAEENLPGVTISGKKMTWDDMRTAGYELRSCALCVGNTANRPSL